MFFEGNAAFPGLELSLGSCVTWHSGEPRWPSGSVQELRGGSAMREVGRINIIPPQAGLRQLAWPRPVLLQGETRLIASRGTTDPFLVAGGALAIVS